ncbi:nucleotidyltransferase domain-containing protein [Ottowia thiooxydans]|uniref:Nucleotidyltransferase n=1 Tax=Ottowia thiooxydans TaxID=219182 RepID=A0ABV2QHH8_9BURK
MKSFDDFMPACIEIPPPKPLQPEFVDVVNDALDSLRKELGPVLDSLYLYGSVARGKAQRGKSDLDLTLILTRSLATHEMRSLERVRSDLQDRHPEVSKIDFDIGVLEDVLSPDNLYSWGYWLKHECRCIYGTDLALRFKAFQPSRSIAQAINGDYMQVLGDYVICINAAEGHAEMQRLQKEAARKLLRATNVLRPLSDSYWPVSLADYAEYFSASHPEMAHHVEFFLTHANTPYASSEAFNDKLVFFLAWMKKCELLSTPA